VSRNRLVFFLLTVLAWNGGFPATAQDIPAIRMTLAARALQPGELVVISLVFAAPPTAVHLTAFDMPVPAFQVGERRWQALVGVDLDQAPGEYTFVADGIVEGSAVGTGRSVVVIPKRFPTRTLRVAPEFVNPPIDVQTRIDDEAAFLQRVYSGSSAEPLWRSPFVRPVPHRANSRFGTRSVFNGERRNPHAGTDFLSPAGTPIKAPAAGRVAVARDLFFSGNTVIIDHGASLFSTLAHLSRIDVVEGDSLEAGQRVGLVGATGRVTGAHLHWALRVGRARVDALSALALLGKPPR
jgi:murein DD-endopeptidase MepM/ murein hydrolase activator NlpD